MVAENTPRIPIGPRRRNIVWICRGPGFVSRRRPPNNHRDFGFEARPDKYNIYDDSLFWHDDDTDEPASEMEGGFVADWEFRSLFGEIGWLKLFFGVTRNESCGSLYNYNNWIDAINQRINYSVGPRSGRYKEDFLRVRNNWEIQLLDQVEFASYAHYEKTERGIVDVSQFWMIPITDKHYIRFSFFRHIYAKHTNLDRVYDDLIEKLLSTVRIEWSPEALRQQAEAKAKWPDQKLPDSLPELSWSDEEWQAAENEFQREQREFAEEIQAIYAKNGKLQA